MSAGSFWSVVLWGSGYGLAEVCNARPDAAASDSGTTIFVGLGLVVLWAATFAGLAVTRWRPDLRKFLLAGQAVTAIVFIALMSSAT